VSGWSLVQRSSTYCDVPMIVRSPWPTKVCCAMGWGKGDTAVSSNISVNIVLFFQDIPVLMLPSLLVQLLVQTSHELVHTTFFLVSEGSDMRSGLIAVVLCITYIGKPKISCSMSSLEIIRQVLIQKWLLYYTTHFETVKTPHFAQVVYSCVPCDAPSSQLSLTEQL
jgi:hypothetical protein